VGSSLGRSAALLAALLILPHVLGEFWAFQLSLYFLYAAAALGIGICWGQAGFLPLGQALFFGLGAYLSGFALLRFADSWLLALLLPLAALAPGALAWVIGLLVFRGRTESGPYFALITLAIALLAFQMANSWNQVTGGYNGLKGIPALPGLDGFTAVYHVAAVALAGAVAVAGWLAEAPIGVLWRALAQNERRVSFFGYDTARLKAAAFGVSGALAGAAGVLYAPQQGLVTPEQCGFVLSADLVIWAAVGGRRFVLGPVVGTVLIGVLTAELRDRIGWWEIVVAAIFIAVVLWAPGGLAGLAAPLSRGWPRRRGTAGAGTAPPRALRRDPVTLRMSEISSSAGGVQILDALSLAIERPGVYCLIGPNGAGKTSAFNVLTGELPAQRGEVHLDGARLASRVPHRMALLGVARKFQIPSVLTDLSVADNLGIALWSGRASARDLVSPSLRRWDSALLGALRERFAFLADGERPAAALSHGERQLLELVMALASEPRLLLLDEPCGGLSSGETQQVIEAVRWARQTMAVTVVIVEHDMALVKELADHVFVLHQGRLLAEGDVPAVRADRRVHEVYVGVAE
jgi:branched-chain amino acid transport system permease protein